MISLFNDFTKRPFLISLGLKTLPTAELEARYLLPSSKFVHVFGIRVHYTDEGEGEPVVLLHGVLSSLHTWKAWTEELVRAGKRVIRIDLPGFGLTGPDPEERYTPEFSVSFLREFFSVLGLTSFALVGNSMGGFLSALFAARYPELVSHLILVNPAAYPQKMPGVLAPLGWPFIRKLSYSAAPFALVKRGIDEVYANPSLIQKETYLRHHELLLREGNRKAGMTVLGQFRELRNKNPYLHQIKSIKSPSLLLWGKQDRWVPFSHVELWKRDVPHLHVVLYGHGGHVPMEECPNETVSDALSFLKAEKV